MVGDESIGGGRATQVVWMDSMDKIKHSIKVKVH